MEVSVKKYTKLKNLLDILIELNKNEFSRNSRVTPSVYSF